MCALRILMSALRILMGARRIRMGRLEGLQDSQEDSPGAHEDLQGAHEEFLRGCREFLRTCNELLFFAKSLQNQGKIDDFGSPKTMIWIRLKKKQNQWKTNEFARYLCWIIFCVSSFFLIVASCFWFVMLNCYRRLGVQRLL